MAAAQSLPLLAWFKLINDTVPEPYLDEVFHVRQAQRYCNHQFTIWDDKITTPPGLYLLSYLFSKLVGCDLVWLRCLNLFCITTLQTVITATYYLRRKPGTSDAWAIQHSALNATFLPPLFFFAALYYTDVASTLSVLTYYWLFLHFNRNKTSAWISTPILTIVGIWSLFFRQTNIFWVAVFPAGVLLVDQLDRGHPAVQDSMQRRVQGFGDSMSSVARISWKMNIVYNPPAKDAWLEDYVKTIVSIAVNVAKLATDPSRVPELIQVLAPSFTTSLAFVSFIILNGGVVLGDKSNHVATLHLPQMLYIWPYFAFFSWPLVYPYLATVPIGLFAKLPDFATLESMLMFKRRGLIPRLSLIAFFCALACVVVHFNTIVHPFTLADNRHYTFYVFRLLMRPWWVKYAVTPVYVLTGWACIQALGARPIEVAAPVLSSSASSSSSESKPPPPEQTKQQRRQEQQQQHQQSLPSTPSIPSQSKSLNLPDGQTGAKTSFVLIWLATTTLQLITAPLVEPRYLILPWLFWRLHVPLQQHYTPVTTPQEPDAEEGTWETVYRVLKATDHRLWFESFWLLAVNAVVGYMFLYRGFEWPQEPGKVQRFMW